MGKLIARELDELKWGLAGCLLSSAFRLLPFISFIRSHDGCQKSEGQP